MLELSKLELFGKMGLEGIFLAQLWEAVCLDQNEPKRLAYVETLYLSHMFLDTSEKTNSSVFAITRSKSHTLVPVPI